MTQTKERTTITCAELTKPLPIYSHAAIHNGIIYISGVQGFIPGTFEFPSQEPYEQTRQVFANMKVILGEAGSDLGHVLKLTILMTDALEFPKINEAINEAFPESPPARTSIVVHELPAHAKVVIEAIAAVRND